MRYPIAVGPDKVRFVIDRVLLLILLAISSIPLHLIVSSYVYGDQVYYRKLYEMLSYATSINDIFVSARAVVSSREVVSPIILWFGSYLGVDKDVYITILNLVLLGSLVLFLRKYRAGWFVILLSITNFYLIVLFTGAERLKIGYIFILFAGLSSGKLRFFMIALSMLAHFQMILMVGGLMVYFKIAEIHSILSNVFFRLKIRLRYIVEVGGLLLLLGVLLSLPGVVEGIVTKGVGYLRADGLSIDNLFQFAALSVCFVLGRRFSVSLNVFAFMLFFFVAIVLLGGERANMIFFTSAFSILVFEKRLGVFRFYSFPFLLVMLYLSFKSIDFVSKVFAYGDGFYGI